jgi:hypothetical protein
MSRQFSSLRFVLVGIAMLSLASSAFAAANPFVGYWALTIPGGGAGWLGVEEKDGKLAANVLWGGGSVLPVTSATVEGDALILTRVQKNQKRDAKGKASGPVTTTTETITAKIDGDNLKLTTVKKNDTGPEFGKADFTGKRIPPLPAKPDLSKVKFGQPITLFDGKNLDGWKLVSAGSVSGWTIIDGVLNNNPVQEPGKPHKNYGNLRTVQEFEDFNLKLETNVPKGGNSGIYLRGIYEIQVADTFGKPLDSHNMGGLYSRITPAVAAEKPAGEWQTYDITLVDRYLTVILNGKTIIDNQPVLGCTGGALWSDQFRPGPLYLQGDHTGANYRNIVLTPVVK